MTPGTPGGVAPPSGGGAMPLPPHGITAKSILKLKWNFPIHNIYRREEGSNATIAQKVSKALAKEHAFYTVAAEDRRPLLILRECKSCNDTDEALLSTYESNEETMIITRWFNCIKLPIDVMEEDHPFHNLFEKGTKTHLFVSRWDGTKAIPLKRDLSRSELLGNMYEILEIDYKKDAEKSVKEIAKLMYVYDMLDERIQRLEIAIDDEIEKNGPKSKRLKKYQSQLKEAQKDMADAKAREAKLSDLKLKNPKERLDALEKYLDKQDAKESSNKI